MGRVRRVLITGASGFIGQATVKAANAAGLEVIALQRGTSRPIENVTYVSTDLTVQDALPILTGALAGCDAVIHLAAAMSGSLADHKRLTIGGTQTLLAAMAQAEVRHLTLASSIAVFDTLQVPIGGDLTDTCALENPAMSRDAYSGAKARQEHLARAAQLDSLAVLRPGIVYDDDHLWNAHLGIRLGPALIRIGNDSALPMCHVERCAAALVYATVQKTDLTMTLLDSTLPTRAQVITALRKTGWPTLTVPFPWQVMWVLAKALRPLSSRLPGLLRESVLRQRMLPMGYRMNDPFDEDVLPNPAPDWGAAT